MSAFVSKLPIIRLRTVLIQFKTYHITIKQKRYMTIKVILWRRYWNGRVKRAHRDYHDLYRKRDLCSGVIEGLLHEVSQEIIDFHIVVYERCRYPS